MKSPENILRKCAKLLGPKTDGKVISDVCTTHWTDVYQDTWTKFDLWIRTGKRQNYCSKTCQCLLSVKHKEGKPYPCEIDGWNKDCLLPCVNEEILKDHIKRTLHSQKVISIIGSWIICANEAEIEDKEYEHKYLIDDPTYFKDMY